VSRHIQKKNQTIPHCISVGPVSFPNPLQPPSGHSGLV
jgi:hypothetical protein